MPLQKLLFLNTVLDFLIPKVDSLKLLLVFLETSFLALWHSTMLILLPSLQTILPLISSSPSFSIIQGGCASSICLPLISAVSFCSFSSVHHVLPWFNFFFYTNNFHKFISTPQFCTKLLFPISIWLIEISCGVYQQDFHLSICTHKLVIFCPFSSTTFSFWLLLLYIYEQTIILRVTFTQNFSTIFDSFFLLFIQIKSW